MKLVIEDEVGTRSVVPFAEDAIVVGRAAEGITFRLGDRNVSRRHARFLLQGGAVFVEDLGSQNGTRVNGERITGKRRLRDGDLIQIGDYDLAVLAERQALAPDAPPPLPAAPRTGSETPTQPCLLGATAASPLPAAAVQDAGDRSAAFLRIALVVAGVAAVAALLALALRP